MPSGGGEVVKKRERGFFVMLYGRERGLKKSIFKDILEGGMIFQVHFACILLNIPFF